MKIVVFLCVLVALSFSARSQVKIELTEVSKHVGDSVEVRGKVYTARYFADSKNTPTLLNLGAGYPNQLLTVVIYGDARKEFDTAPEVLFKDQTIKVIGKIELYKDRPQIVIHSKKQIVMAGL